MPIPTRENDIPVRIYVWDKDYAPKGQVFAPNAVEALGLSNNGGMLTFTLNSDHPRVVDLATEGSRASVRIRRDLGDGTYVWKTIVSGPVEEYRGEGVVPKDVRIFSIEDDFYVFEEILCWPDPTAAITAQAQKFYTSAGNAEDVLLDLIDKNAPRDGVVLSTEATQNRGPFIWQNMRFHNLLDKMFPAVLTRAGLRVQVTQEPGETTRTVRISEMQTHTRVLTEDSGVILPGAEFSVRAPEATRVIVGSGGEGTDREYREFVNTAVETQWGMSKSKFVDATDIEIDDPDLEDRLQEAGEQALEEFGPKISLKVELVETPGFQFGVSFDVGDLVKIRLSGHNASYTARIHEVELTWNATDGLLIIPRVGEWSDSPNDRMYRLISRLLRSSRNREVVQ